MNVIVFTALHGMQTLSGNENSVCPSVCLSNAWIVTKGIKICPDFYTIRKIIYPSFLRRRMVGGGNPFYPFYRLSEIADFEPIFARSASAVTPTENVQLTPNY